MYMNVDLNYCLFHFGLPLYGVAEAPFTTAKSYNILSLKESCKETKTSQLFSARNYF
jgi:hypothetical protein